jgi:hypothetical protein
LHLQGFVLKAQKEDNHLPLLLYLQIQLLAYLNQKRMPVILHSKDENRWLKEETTLARILQCLNIYPANLMNAYPIAVPSVELNDVTLVKPAGDPLYQEQQEFRLQAKKPKESIFILHIIFRQEKNFLNLWVPSPDYHFKSFIILPHTTRSPLKDPDQPVGQGSPYAGRHNIHFQ